MDPRTDKLIRRTTMVATCTAAYFLLTADYGPEDNVLLPKYMHLANRDGESSALLLAEEENGRKSVGAFVEG